MAQSVVQRTDVRIEALRDTIAEMLSFDGPRKLISGLDVVYDLGEGHPLLGRRMPDLDLIAPDGPLRVFALLHDARPVLLNLGKPGSIDITAGDDRARLVDAAYDGVWELPVIGTVPAPAAVLIRPDGHVAWVGDARKLVEHPPEMNRRGSRSHRRRRVRSAPGAPSRPGWRAGHARRARAAAT
jgi:3-(3-hydroxy-phenyl)propionate hydroxylase